MKTLLILRHAKSSWSNANLSDHDRPLNKRGKGDAPAIGKLIRQQDIVPDLMLSSTAERAFTTAEMVAIACGYEETVRAMPQFYLASPNAYVETLAKMPAIKQSSPETIMVVGHNPGVAELVEDLTAAFVRMPTAALAQVRLPIATWSELSLDTSGELMNYWEPRELPY